MPRIHDAMLGCAVYLYPSLEDARAGAAAGGTGFVVGVPRSDAESQGMPFLSSEMMHLYLVTAGHVIKKGAPVARINMRAGPPTILELPQDAWLHPLGASPPDIAVCPVELSPEYAFACVSLDAFITHEALRAANLGPGDDVFMVGRFVSHEGKQANTPTLRFGNLAMMPEEPLVDEYGVPQESFLVEMHSLPGYSGSPVFLYVLPSTRPYRESSGGPIQNWLLGVDWSHLNARLRVRDGEGHVVQGWWAEGNSGMAGVIPAWKIRDLLMEDILVQARADAEAAQRLAAGVTRDQSAHGHTT